MFYANRDMLTEAKAYAEYVKALMSEPDAEMFVESKVDIIPEYDISGHVDACVIDGGTLHVIDLKTGAGAVSAENNSQMMMYALGLYYEHEMFYDIDNIHLHIVQDNAKISNSNSWECSVDELKDFGDWITERARLALQEDSECTPSEKACQWCTHASKCVALNNEVVDMFAELEERGDDVPVDELPLDTITAMLANRGLFDRAMKAYEERIADELKQGKQVEGYKLVKGRKNKRWVDETEAFNKLKSWLPLDEVAPRKICSPSQAQKLLGKSISTRKKNTFEELYETPEGELQLAPSTDKRPAVNPTEEFEEL
jgi:hypothetical protein